MRIPDTRIARRRRLAAAPGAICLALLAAALLAPSAGARGWQPVDASGIQGIKLFDLGVADTNDDGNLDIFTVNHKFDSSFLLGTGFGTFIESTTPYGLNPTQAFPGFEALRRDPVATTPGLYIYATDRDEPRDPLHIDAVGIPASGTLVFGSNRLQVESTGGAEVSAGERPDGSATLEFEAEAGEAIDVSVDHIDLPISVSIDPPTAPGQIRVGADAVAATSRQFQLDLRDRHGYAFGDYDADGATDLFVASGGLGGDIAEPFFTPLARDELLLSRGARYVNATPASGLVKGNCRGRGALTGDLDGDGRLDLIETCEGAPPRVWVGDGAGGFAEAAAPPAIGSTHRLVDVLGDRRPELLAAAGERLQVWRYASGLWIQVDEVRTLNGDLPVEHLSLGDLEADGDLDVLAGSAGGNTILLARDDGLRRFDPTRIGLPASSRASTFVDYDNDGDLDLHLMPQGLYERDLEADRFERTRRLDYDRAGLAYAIDNWLDIDEDGRREPLTARGRDEFAASQTVELRRNTVRGGHWLEVDLVGPPGNAQALGASVRLKVGKRSLHQWVGQNDDARFSSGHYRLYWGLGAKRRVRELIVTWPDGSKRRLRGVRGDRLLRIAHERSGAAGPGSRE